MLKIINYFVLFLILTLASFSAKSSSLEEIAYNSYWLKLLHYEKTITGYESYNDSKDFFFAADGKNSPLGELEATITALKDTSLKVGRVQQQAQCAFPERTRYLKSKGIKLPTVQCKDYLEWVQGIDAESVDLIFSTSYPNNPASLFGHTLFRFNKRNKKNDLLDYGLTFSAQPSSNDVGPLYVIKGIFGFYPGFVSISKYYETVNIYNNSENRDLWEYHLNLNQTQIQKLLGHIWELYSTSYFDYFFFDENCSSVLHRLLALVAPGSWEINYWWYYLPSDLVKYVSKNNLVTQVNFRPSLKRKLRFQLDQLSSDENKELYSYLNGESKKVTSIKALDTAITYIDFKKRKNKGELSKNEMSRFRKALQLRAKNLNKSEALLIPEATNRPDHSHGARRFQLSQSKDRVMLSLKAGYQDLLGSDKGLEPFSQFSFIGGDLSYDYEISKVVFDEFNLISIYSLEPFRPYDKQISWSTTAKMTSLKNYGHKNRFKTSINGLGGISFDLWSFGKIYLLVGADLNYTILYKNNIQITPRLESGVLVSLLDKSKLHFLIHYDEDLFDRGVLKFGFENSFFISNNFDFRLKLYQDTIKRNHYNSYQVEMGWWF
jgi:hypothetical protein